jgi:hypothetical protein
MWRYHLRLWDCSPLLTGRSFYRNDWHIMYMAIIQEHAATAEELRTEIAEIEEAEEHFVETEYKSQSSLSIKRRRT